MIGLMTAFVVIALIAIGLLVLAFVAPRWSRRPQGAIDRELEHGEQKSSHAPGLAGKELPKPLEASEKLTDKATDAGRSARAKLDG
jgi:hypothetical protein